MDDQIKIKPQGFGREETWGSGDQNPKKIWNKRLDGVVNMCWKFPTRVAHPLSLYIYFFQKNLDQIFFIQNPL